MHMSGSASSTTLDWKVYRKGFLFFTEPKQARTESVTAKFCLLPVKIGGSGKL